MTKVNNLNGSFYNRAGEASETNLHPSREITAGSNALKAADALQDRLDVSDTVKNINSSLELIRQEERHCEMDKDLGLLVVRILNSTSKELVRQIPSQEALSISKRIKEMIGILYNRE